jgi:excisionase family DNA binding protein
MKAIVTAIQRIQARDVEKKLAVMGEALSKRRSAQGGEELLTTKEIAPLLGVSHPKTVEKWVREKGLPCVRLGRNLRFRLGDVLRWRDQQG